MSRVDALSISQTDLSPQQVSNLQSRPGAQTVTVSTEGSSFTGLQPMALRTRMWSSEPMETGTPYSTSTGYFYFAQRLGVGGRREFKFVIYRSCSEGSLPIDHNASGRVARARGERYRQQSEGWRAIPNAQEISSITFVNADSDPAMEVLVRFANGAGVLINHLYRPLLRTGRRGVLDQPSRC